MLGLAISFLLVCGRDAGATSLTQDCSGGGFLVAAVVVAGSALYDIATAPASARRYNERHLAIVPVLDPRRGSYGLSVSLSFGRSSRAGVGAFAAPGRKSPSTAFVLSFASTAGPMLAGAATGTDAGWQVFLGGLVIGPSVGHLYAGQVGRGLGTIALRGAGTALGLYSIVGCFTD
jgi:hypothetical protein